MLAAIDIDGGRIWIIVLIVTAICSWMAGMWRLFVLAGKPGHLCLAPVINGLCIVEIVGRPRWHVVLVYLPPFCFVYYILVNIDLAKHFGRGTAFGWGLALLPFIFYPLLAFSQPRAVANVPPPAAGGI